MKIPKPHKSAWSRLRRKKRKRSKREPDEFLQSIKWRNLANHVKRRDKGLCQEMLRRGVVKAGVQVDHILPRYLFPELSYDENNLELLSIRQHSLKTIYEMRCETREEARKVIDHMRKIGYEAYHDKYFYKLKGKGNKKRR